MIEKIKTSFTLFSALSERSKKLLIYSLLLAVLFALPVKLQADNFLPLISQGEEEIAKFTKSNLRRLLEAYDVVVGLDSAIAMARSLQTTADLNLDIYIFNTVGITGGISPAEFLSPYHDSIKGLADFYTYGILVTIIESNAGKVLTYIAFKIFLPLVVSIFLLGQILPIISLRCLSVAFAMLKITLFFGFALPTTAYIGNIVNDIYFDEYYETQLETLQKELISTFSTSNQEIIDFNRLSFKELNSEIFSDLSVSKIKKIITAPDKILGGILNLLLFMFSVLAILVFAIPIIVLLLLYLALKATLNPLSIR